MSPPIWDHRMLGDGRTTALIQPDGTVDWWCAPEPDSPPLAWSLLDPDGGVSRWVDARPLELPGDEIAGTASCSQIATPEGVVECMDGVLQDGRATLLVRLVRSTSGPVTLTHELRLGGFDAPSVRWDGPRGWSGERSIEVVSDGDVTAEGPTLRSRITAVDDAWTGVAVVVNGTPPARAGALADALARRHRDDLEHVQRCTVPGHHPELARRALAVLRACTYHETGSVLAAPTTSLPEVPGADRQFDYRYTWLRDSAVAVSVAAPLGELPAAQRYLEFLDHLGVDGILASPLHTVRGGPIPEEREIPGVAGWCGSKPVRVGNAAAHQVQYDVLGIVIEAVASYLDAGGSLGRSTWRLVRFLADRAVPDPPGPTHGIWELRRPRQLVSADIGRWLALDRAVAIARRHKPWARTASWVAARDAAKAQVLRALRPDGRLPQSYDGHEPDASSLLVVIFGMLGVDDPRAGALVDDVIGTLGAGPFLRRYPPTVDDGFGPCNAAFLPASWWAVAALASLGRLDEARDRADAMCGSLAPMQSECVDPSESMGLGNVPLVWSHIEAARAMYVLDRAEVTPPSVAP